jgi:23S rRNA (guanine745-N1)-methyltransferase
VARSGYVNLLQPQDRRSRRAGDSKESVAARIALLSAGIGLTILHETVAIAACLDSGRAPVVVDLGAGAGDLLGLLSTRSDVTGIGIDLSIDAAAHAAARFPSVTWVVANADRRLPLLDASVHLVVSTYGRRNSSECARVLSAGGHLLVSVPAPDDLHELRSVVEGPGVARHRETALIDELRAFRLVERTTLREHHQLERSSLVHLLHATYRGARRSEAAKVDTLGPMAVTLASVVFLFRAR